MKKLPIILDKQSGVPIYVQLEERIRLLVRAGALRPGDAMPTVRMLAVQLEINANTVARVYRELQTAGVLRLERGVGTFVADGTAPPMSRREFEKLERRVTELIRFARGAGFSADELAQLIQARWQEDRNVAPG